MPQPTLLIIGPTPPPFHGVSVAMSTLLESPLRQRFQLLHLDLADRRGIQHVDKPDFHDVLLFLRQWVRLMRILITERPGLVYLALSQSTIGFLRDSVFIWPASVFGAHVVVHLHGGNFHTWYLHRSWVMRAYVRAVMKRVAHGIVLGESLKGLFDGLIRHDRISVVPNGVLRGSAGTPLADKHAPPDRPLFRVIFLSTLSRQKGLFILLQAIPLVVREHKDVEFCIAGPWWGPTTQADANAWITDADVTPYVRFVGEVTGSNKTDLLRSGDVFVFPGVQQEGQPLTVLEAMSEGLPVIATDRGCLRETVTEGATGFIVPPGSPDAIAEKLLLLIHRPELLQQMARNARERFENEYTMEKFTARMEQVFSKTLTSAQKPHTTNHLFRSTEL